MPDSLGQPMLAPDAEITLTQAILYGAAHDSTPGPFGVMDDDTARNAARVIITALAERGLTIVRHP